MKPRMTRMTAETKVLDETVEFQYTGENSPHRWAAGTRISFSCMTNLRITLVCRNASKNAAEMRTHQRCLNFNLKEDPVQEYICMPYKCIIFCNMALLI